MVFKEVILQALTALINHRFRAMMTMLGISWGIVTVVLLMAYGDGFHRALMFGFRGAFSDGVVITYGGWQDLQYVDDVAKIFVRCLEAPYSGAKSFNLRGDVVDLPAFHQALCDVEPAAKKLITFGERQIAIAYDLDDSAIQKDLGPLPKTPLRDGIRQTLDLFRRLQREGRLDTADLDA